MKPINNLTEAHINLALFAIAIALNGWKLEKINTSVDAITKFYGHPQEVKQYIFTKGRKEFDILPLYDAHMGFDKKWCIEAYRRDEDYDICVVTDPTDPEQLRELLTYINL